MKMLVHVKEVWTRGYIVEADNQQDAIQKAREALDSGKEDDTGGVEYSHTMPAGKWTVTEMDEPPTKPADCMCSSWCGGPHCPHPQGSYSIDIYCVYCHEGPEK